MLSLHTRGLTVRERHAHLEACYQVPVSPDLISAVTDETLPALQAWQQRPLAPALLYPLHVRRLL